MRRENPGAFRVSIEEGKDSALHTMMQADICIFQRPFSDQCVKRAEMAKLAGCKIWIDWDDHVAAVPKTNKVWPCYQFPNLGENLERLQGIADVITVSTENLAEVYGKHPEKVRVLHNAVEDRLIPANPITPTRKVIMWRGSDSHMHDLATFRDVFVEFAKEYPDWKFCFIGRDPSLVLHGMPEGSWHGIGEMQYYELMDKLKFFAAPVHIVPLADHDFNRGKSNLAYLEASCSGSATLAPDWPEWRQDGICLYRGPEGFLDQLRKLVTSPQLCEDRAKTSLNHVRERYALSVATKTRWDIIQKLTTN
jgi:glycosyltransferase involved in cell wall biosynthesis